MICRVHIPEKPTQTDFEKLLLPVNTILINMLKPQKTPDKFCFKKTNFFCFFLQPSTSLFTLYYNTYFSLKIWTTFSALKIEQHLRKRKINIGREKRICRIHKIYFKRNIFLLKHFALQTTVLPIECQ